MNWFYNLKIRTKLILGFLIVVIITCLVGYLAISNIRTLNERDTFLYQKTTVPLVSLGKINFSFNKIGANTRDLFLAEDSAGIALAKKKIYVSSDSIKSALKDYYVTFTDKKDEIEYNKFIEIYSLYFSELESIIGMVETGRKSEAWAFFIGDHHKSLNATRKQAQSMTDHKIKAARETSQENTSLSNSIILHLSLWILAGIIVAMSLGFFIAKVIGKPVKRLVEAANKLSLGDIDLQLNSGTNDELGELERSFSVMIENIKAQAHAAEKIARGETALDIKVNSDKDILSKSIALVAETLRNLIHEVSDLNRAGIEGKLHFRGNADKFQGGYKEIVSGFNTTLDTVVKPVDESSKTLELIASGDLTVSLAGDYKGDYILIKKSINRLIESFNNALNDVALAVESTASAGSRISISSEEMALGAQKQSIQTSEVAASVDEMTRTIIHTTQNSLRAAQSAKDAGIIARAGGEVVNETIEGMNRIALVVQESAAAVQALGKSSNEIGEIIQVIDDIADQTNLLALNAAIEAARAGEQGRGFAVVADEVRKLAERTTKATKEIANMIGHIRNVTDEAVNSMHNGTVEVEKGKELANRAGASLEKIISGTEEVTSIISQLAAASEQQSSTAEQISKNIELINNITRENAAGAQQIAYSSEDLNKLTVNLQELISKFRITGTVRSAEMDSRRSPMALH